MRFPSPVKFICGLIYTNEFAYEKARIFLQKKFGAIDYQSQPLEFVYTDYYRQEMGHQLIRRFISFARLKDPSCFIKIKHRCLAIEKKLSHNSRRTVNIDPGYLNHAKLVLTTTKDFSHRIYLGSGVYAEVTLYYKNDAYCDFPTTFPDYRSQTYKNIFQHIRNLYHQDIKQGRC